MRQGTYRDANGIFNSQKKYFYLYKLLNDIIALSDPWSVGMNMKQGGKVGTLGRQMREILAMLGWLTPLYLVCVLYQSA